MQLTKSEQFFNMRKVEKILEVENKFVTELFSVLCLPTRSTDEESENEEQQNQGISDLKLVKKTRAQSLSELQQRLQVMTGKKKLTYKEKMVKKNLKNRVKKKTKQDERNAQQKLLRGLKTFKQDAISEEHTVADKTKTKPLFNSEGKMVFSKIDFSKLGKQTKKNKKNVEKDPKKLLQNLEKQKEKLEELQDSGDLSKVVEIKEKVAWKNALSKAEGVKVKDDPILLKKSVHKQEQKKRASKKKWEKRKDNVERMKRERQEKRSANIEKRKKEKQTKKLKKAVKKGKIIPGY